MTDAVNTPPTDTQGDETIGWQLIRAERARQIEVEGYTPEHDAGHGPVILRRAGHCYAAAVSADDPVPGGPYGWPWYPRYWKPRGRLRNLVRAGALFMAANEINDAGGVELQRCAESIDSLLAEVDAARPVPAATHTDPAAQASGPGWFWTQDEWAEWSNDLAMLIPEDDMAGNPDGAQESIIKDTLAMYVRDRLAAQAPAPIPGTETVLEYGLRLANGEVCTGEDEGLRWTREQAENGADVSYLDDEEPPIPDVLVCRTVTTTSDVVTEWADA